MPDPALQAYLAKNYLDGAKAEAYLARASGSGGAGEKRKKKKKKRSDGEEAAAGRGLRLMDDEEETTAAWRRGAGSDDDEAAVVVEDDGEAQRAKRSKWNKLGNVADPAVEEEQPGDLPQVANAQGRSLDATAQETAERELRRHPQQREHAAPAAGPSNITTTIRAGLKTREEMRAERIERERRDAEEAQRQRRQSARETADEAEAEAARREREREQHQQATVYRDASGRRIDVAKEEEERARERAAEERHVREKRDWNKGDVQKEQARAARRREEEARSSKFARYANDEAMNAELRTVRRENDPAARFLREDKGKAKATPQRPTYKGSFPPNRFGIRPGHRWDGVERSNGFEAKLFTRRNERSRRKQEEQAWRQEDM